MPQVKAGLVIYTVTRRSETKHLDASEKEAHWPAAAFDLAWQLRWGGYRTDRRDAR